MCRRKDIAKFSCFAIHLPPVVASERGWYFFLMYHGIKVNMKNRHVIQITLLTNVADCIYVHVILVCKQVNTKLAMYNN